MSGERAAISNQIFATGKPTWRRPKGRWDFSDQKGLSEASLDPGVFRRAGNTRYLPRDPLAAQDKIGTRTFVSIIIPVMNKAELTIKCIAAIRKTLPGPLRTDPCR